MSQGIFFIFLFFPCYDISTLVTYLMIKHIYILSYVASAINSFNQLQYDE